MSKDINDINSTRVADLILGIRILITPQGLTLSLTHYIKGIGQVQPLEF